MSYELLARRRVVTFVLAFALLNSQSTIHASAQTSRPTTGATTSTTESAPATTTDKVEPEPDRYLAVINGVVHTITGPVLDDATILSKNGRIIAMGAGVQLPADCEVVDARGMNVYPGLVAVSASGIHGGKNPEDTTDLFDFTMQLALAGGITTALAGNEVAKLTFGTTPSLTGDADAMVIRRDVYTNLNYTSNRPLDRAETWSDFERVRAYLRDLRRHELEKAANPDAKPPDKDWLKGKYENYRKLIAHESVAVASANRVQELLLLAELAGHFDFELVVRGGFEGWLVADELARAGVSVIVTPRTSVAPDEDFNRATGATIENARILHEHGVRVALIPGSTGISLWGVAGRDLLHLNMEAAFAVRGGLSNDDAIEAITIDAARVLGVDDRVGSLEIGKDADMIVADGDILHFMTHVHYTVVNGRLVYSKSEETLYAHIRPDGKPVETSFDDMWPRRLEWPEEPVEARE